MRQRSLISICCLSFRCLRGVFTLLVSVVGQAFGFLFFLFLYNGNVCGKAWPFVCFFKNLEASKLFCTYFSTASKEGLDVVFCMLACDFTCRISLCALGQRNPQHLHVTQEQQQTTKRNIDDKIYTVMLHCCKLFIPNEFDNVKHNSQPVEPSL